MITGAESASSTRSATRHAALHPGDAAEDQRELVAAQPRGHVARPGDRREPAADLGEHEVAAAVPERLVDLLEALEPDHQDADLPALALGACSARASTRATSSRFESPVTRSWRASCSLMTAWRLPSWIATSGIPISGSSQRL